MRRRRLHVTSTDPERLQGDLRATNRQDSIDAPARWRRQHRVVLAGEHRWTRLRLWSRIPNRCSLKLDVHADSSRCFCARAPRFLRVTLRGPAVNFWKKCGFVLLRRTFALLPPRSFRRISGTSSPREASRNTTRRVARRSSRCSSASAPSPFRRKWSRSSVRFGSAPANTRSKYFITTTPR